MNEQGQDDRAFINDILLEIKRARHFTAGMDKRRFTNDELVCHAVVRCIQIIGEAARSISEKFRAQHPKVEWKKIIGMRNLITHSYGRVDYGVVWEVIEKDLDTLEKNLKDALREK